MRKSIENRYSHRYKAQEVAEQKLSFKQKLALFCVALFCILLSVFVFAPAVWLSSYIDEHTSGQIELSDAEGSLWNGSAIITVAVDKESAVTPLLPGRFEWHLSPILLLGQVELVVDNPAALQQPLYITGNLHNVQISPNALNLPASRLAGLGAPLNTVQPSGQMVLSWDVLGLSWINEKLDVNGTMKLTLTDMASALSQIKPLGSYAMSFDWHGTEAEVNLKTIHGPMLLNGKGMIKNGRLQFSGTAQAEDKQEENLSNLLNLLGQRRPGMGKNVISLEFK